MEKDLVIFPGYQKGEYRLCSRYWDGGPDRPDYTFIRTINKKQAQVLCRSGVANGWRCKELD